MTRSTRSVPTHKQAKKAFKQSAIDAGINNKPEIYTLWNKVVADSEKNKARKPPLVSARNPRRMDGSRWNGSTFVCPARVEDSNADSDTNDIDGSSADSLEQADERAESGEQQQQQQETIIAPSRIVCLLDMARPAKPKGIGKGLFDFEVVNRLPGVIVLEDEEGGTWAYGGWEFSDWEFSDDDNWEEILVDGPMARGGGPVRKSFAEVLREGG